MTSFVRLLLPQHVPSGDVLVAIAAACGATERRVLGDGGPPGKPTPPVDVSAPCSETNTWHVWIPDRHRFGFALEAGEDCRQAAFFFHDPTHQPHEWRMLLDHEDEGSRCVRAPVSALNVALCERLLDLFGGRLECQVGAETVHMRRVHAGVLSPAKGEDSNPRFYRRQNGLGAIPIVTAADLRSAAARLPKEGLTDSDKRLVRGLEKGSNREPARSPADAEPTLAPVRPRARRVRA